MLRLMCLFQVDVAFQQTGFVRSKRYGVPKSMRNNLGYLQAEDGVPHTMMSDEDLLGGEKRSPWVSLREALDQDQVKTMTENHSEKGCSGHLGHVL